MRGTTFLRWAAALLLAGSCGNDDAGGGAFNSRSPSAPQVNNPGGNAPRGGADGAFGNPGAAGSGAQIPVIPPEVEVMAAFEQPQASERFVYAANPDSGSVSIIDAQALSIETIEAGVEPRFLRTLAGSDDAIVLNVGSDDATIIRSPGAGTRTSTVDVVRGANAIAVTPDGRYAVVYFNSRFARAGNASGSFQDVTVIALGRDGEEDRAIGMTVGFRPRDVFFRADYEQAYVVTDDGISVLDFAEIDAQGTGIARLIALGPDADQQGLDVSVTPDGHYALARRPDSPTVRLVNLDSGETFALDLSEHVAVPPPAEETGEGDAGTPEPAPFVAEVTDLDLSPSGAFALAAVRNASTVLRIPVPQGFEDPSAIEAHVIEGEFVGSVSISPSSESALLYTTAANVERITVLDLAGDDDPRTVALRKSVAAVAIAPDSETALIIHTRADGDPAEPGLSPDQQIDRSYGYSVLRVTTGDVKLQVTPAPPGVFTMVPDGDYLFLLFAGGTREVQKVETKSFLVTTSQLGSPPISIGSVPKSERVFVNQEHPDGRITFIDWKTSKARTVTGFELNSRIQD